MERDLILRQIPKSKFCFYDAVTDQLNILYPEARFSRNNIVNQVVNHIKSYKNCTVKLINNYKNGIYGSKLELQATADVFEVHVCVYSSYYGQQRYNPQQQRSSTHSQSYKRIHLYRHSEGTYDSLIYKAQESSKKPLIFYGTTGTNALDILLMSTYQVKCGLQFDGCEQAQKQQDNNAPTIQNNGYHTSALQRNTTDSVILQIIREAGLKIVQIQADGNCLFRAIAHQLKVVYQSDQDHLSVRGLILQHVFDNRRKFEPYMLGKNVEMYVEEKNSFGTWGGQIELQATSELFKVNITVYDLMDGVWHVNNFPDNNIRIYLSYHSRNHYNSLVHMHHNITNQGEQIEDTLDTSNDHSDCNSITQIAQQFNNAHTKAQGNNNYKSKQLQGANEQHSNSSSQSIDTSSFKQQKTPTCQSADIASQSQINRRLPEYLPKQLLVDNRQIEQLPKLEMDDLNIGLIVEGIYLPCYKIRDNQLYPVIWDQGQGLHNRSSQEIFYGSGANKVLRYIWAKQSAPNNAQWWYPINLLLNEYPIKHHNHRVV